MCHTRGPVHPRPPARWSLPLLVLAALGCEPARAPGPAVRVYAALLVVEEEDCVPRLAWATTSPPRGLGDPVDLLPREAPSSAPAAWRGLTGLRDRSAPLRAGFFPTAPALALHELARPVSLRGVVTTVLPHACDVAWNDEPYRRLPLGRLGEAEVVGAQGGASRGLLLTAAVPERAPGAPPEEPACWSELALRTLEQAARPTPDARPSRGEAALAAELLALVAAPGPDGVPRLRAVQAALCEDPHLEWILVAARLRAGDAQALAEAEAAGLRVSRRSVLGPLPISNGRWLEQVLDLGRLGPERAYWTGLARAGPEPALAAALSGWAAPAPAPGRDPSPLTVALLAQVAGVLLLVLLRLGERALRLSSPAGARAWLLVGAALCLADLPLGGVDLASDLLGVVALVWAARRFVRAGAASAWIPATLVAALPTGAAVELLAPGWPWTGLLGLPLLAGGLGLLRGLERLHARAERPVVAVWCRGALAVGCLTGLAALLLPQPLVLPRPPLDQPLLARAVHSAQMAERVLPLVLPACLCGLALVPVRRRTSGALRG